MTAASIEDRVTALELEIQQLKTQQACAAPEAKRPWWEERFGAFADSPGYDEATRLGREYRESLRPQSDGEDT